MPDPDRLEERFELGPELGRGGFGVVYAGRDRRDGTPVVLKVPQAPPGPDEAARIAREIELLAALRHPRLVRLVGSARDGEGRIVLAYARVDGVDLEQRLAARPPDPAARLGLARDAAEALDALHGIGLVHRDVKPANFMVEPDGRLKLIDFGLLRPEGQGRTLTATGVLFGTPAYMAPELFEGGRATPASDRWALACLLWELARGRPPFGTSPVEVLAAQRRSPAADRAAFARALAVEPAARPASARELVDGLEAWLLGAAGGPLEEARVAATVRIDGPTRAAGDGPAPARPGPGMGAFPSVLRLIAPALALVAAGWLALRPGPGATAPAPEAPVEAGTDFPPGFAAGLDAELEAAAPGPAGVDPFAWEARLGSLPRLSAWLAWVAGGGEPERLPEPFRTELAAIESRSPGRGLPRLLGIYLESEPARDPVVVPEVAGLEPDPRGPRRGWEGAACRALGRLLSRSRTLVEDLRRDPGAMLPVGLAERAQIAAALAIGGDLDDVVSRVGRVADERARVATWLEPFGEMTRTLLWCTARAIGADPAGAAGLVDRVMVVIDREADGLVHPALMADPHPLLGRAVDEPAGLALLGLLQTLRESLEERMLPAHTPIPPEVGEHRRQLREGARDAFKAALAAGGAKPLPDAAVAFGVSRLVQQFVPDGPAATALYRAHRGRIRAMAPALRWKVAEAVGELLIRGEDSMHPPLSRPELEELVSDLVSAPDFELSSRRKRMEERYRAGLEAGGTEAVAPR